MGKHENNTPKKPKKKKKVLPFILILLTILIVAFIIFIRTPPSVGKTPGNTTSSGNTANGKTGGENNVPQNGESNGADKQRKDKFYTVLLAGTVDDYNTDTIMLCSIDAKNNKVQAVSIPRDTQVDVTAKIKRINGAYGREGVDELCREVGEVTGVYPNFYAVINMKSFIKVVDLIGGVDFNVPYNMVHEDANEIYNIEIYKGQQTLSGKQALEMVRYRGTSASDFGRMELQRDFLLATLKQVMKKFTITQITDMVDIFNESVKTNMPAKDMLWFYMNVVQKMNLENSITFNAMPGVTTGTYNKQDYVYLDAKETVKIINQTINPYTTDLTEDDVHIIHLED